MPDELASGYIGRIGMLNGYRFVKDTSTALLKTANISIEQNLAVSQFYALCQILGKSRTEFARQHTLLPVQRAVVKQGFDHMHGDDTVPMVLSGTALGTALRSAFFCRSCVLADNESYGFSYWHRLHQLDGVAWCVIHHELLLRTDVRDAFSYLPGDLVDQSEIVQNAECALDNEVLKRYAVIMEEFLDRAKPFCVGHVTELLRERREALELRTSINGQRKLLSDLAIERVPAAWLMQIIPKVAEKHPRSYVTCLDGVINSHTPFSTRMYALAAALIWDTPDEFLVSLIKKSYFPIQRRTKKMYGPDFWQGEHLIGVYAKHLGRYSAIAKEVGADVKYLATQLKRNGLPSMGRCKSPGAAGAILACMGGVSLDSACKQYGVDKQCVSPYLMFDNPKFRTALKLMNIPSRNERMNCG